MSEPPQETISKATAPSTEGPQVFISYARSDGAEFAKELTAWLSRNGLKPWLDRSERGIDAGTQFDVEIECAIASSIAVVVVLTPGSTRSNTFVRRELQYALHCQKPIIPIRLEQGLKPPITIATTHWLTPEEALTATLIERLGAISAEPVSVVVEDNSDCQSRVRPLDCSRLPLPIVQMWKRARNAKSAHERHAAAYYVFEVTLKLMAGVAIAEYAVHPDDDDELRNRLRNLARPDVAQWWEFARRLIPVLADRGDSGFTALRDLLLGRRRDDMPYVTALNETVAAILEKRPTDSSTPGVRLVEFFHRMVQYGQREVGAACLRSTEFYEQTSAVLLNGMTELLRAIDALAGRQLLLVRDVSLDGSSGQTIQIVRCMGEQPERATPWKVNERDIARLPTPSRLYLDSSSRHEDTRDASHLTSFYPIAVFDDCRDEVLFIDGRYDSTDLRYVGYVSGDDRRIVDPEDLRLLLSRVLGTTIDEPDLADFATVSRSEHATPDPRTVQISGSEPRRLGPFELLSRIKSGGMGVVYRAFQPSLGRQVAVKRLIKPDSDQAVERFTREIQALGRIEHPGIVRIFTSGNDGEEYFYAMELIDGADLGDICNELREQQATNVDDTLWMAAVSTACRAARSREQSISNGTSDDQRLKASENQHRENEKDKAVEASVLRRSGRTYIRTVVQLIQQIADAAAALHEHGIVHRDIKPGNIILTENGQAVLTDLGLAQLADSIEGKLTRTRQFVGTLRYASPEQILAIDRVDGRSDVYSLGATLWELLTFQPMFGATEKTPDVELMKAIQHREPEPVRRHNTKVPKDLEAVVLKCLEKDPAQRYQTAAELSADLQRWLKGDPVSVRRGIVYRTRKLLRRNRRTTVAAVALATLVGCLSYGYYYAFHKTQVRYFRNVVFRYDVAEGTDPITADIANRRTTSYRISRRGLWGPVLMMEAVNGSGFLSNAATIGASIGEDGTGDVNVTRKIAYEPVTVDGEFRQNMRAYNSYGVEVWAFKWDTPTRGHYVDGHGYPKPRADSGAAFIEFDFSPDGFATEQHFFDYAGNIPKPTTQGYFGSRSTLNEHGRTVRFAYLDQNAQPFELNGACYLTLQYDKDGNEVERRFYNAKDEAVLLENIHRWHATFDSNGNEVSRHFFGLNDEPRAHRDGNYGHTTEFDAYGNQTRITFVDANTKPMLVSGIAGWTSEFDDQGHETSQNFFGLDGKPKRHKDGHMGWRRHYENGVRVELIQFGYEAATEGFSQIRVRYDERGNQIEQSYLDESGNLALHLDGIAGWDSDYDKDGHETARHYFGLNHEPRAHRDGNYGFTARFDKRGNQIEQSYLDEGENLTLHSDGIAGWKSDYDQNGHETARRFFGLNYEPQAHRDGNYGFIAEFNERGNEIRNTWIDASNKPMLISGIAGWKSDFDSQGNEIRREFFGVDGTPKRNADGNLGWQKRYENGVRVEQADFGYDSIVKGYSQFRGHYDTNGKVIEASYLDESGNLILHSDGIAGWRADFDQEGHEIARRYFGLNHEPIAHKNGEYGYISQFDSRGNQTQKTWLGANDKPMLIDGVSGWSSVFDARNNEVERRYLNTDGTLALNNKEGTAGWKCQFDDRNNEVRRAHFGPDEAPILCSENYCVREQKFDDHERLLSLLYFDCDGKPHTSAYNFATMESEYDGDGQLVSQKRQEQDGNTIEIRLQVLAVVPDTQAEKLGMQVGDLLLTYNGSPRAFPDLQLEISRIQKLNKVPETVSAEVSREGRILKFEFAPGPIGANLGHEIVITAPDGRMTQDPRGNLILLEFLNADGIPRLHEGAAGWRSEFDKNRNEIRREFFGVDGQPTRHDSGHMGWTDRYENGLRVEHLEFGYDDSKDGIAQIRQYFDEEGRNIETDLLDDAGNLKISDRGYAVFKSSFNDKDEVVHRSYFDVAGNLVQTHVVVVKVSPFSQASMTGIEAGDVVLSYNNIQGTMIEFINEKDRLIGLDMPAAVVPLRIWRDGKELTIELKPGPIGVEWTDKVVELKAKGQ